LIMFEKGFIDKMFTHYSREMLTTSPDVVSAEATSLEYHNVSFPFLALLTGLLTALAFSVCERTRKVSAIT